MPGEIISIENAEKIANYDKLNEQMNYWKNEHFQLSIKYKESEKKIKKLTEENNSLKEIIVKVNRGNNGRR